MIQTKEFMHWKEFNLLPNRKLKDFYERHNEESTVSVFTMAENVAQFKETEIFASPKRAADFLDSNPVFKKILAEKAARAATETDLQGKSLQEFNTEPIIERNTKELKTLQF